MLDVLEVYERAYDPQFPQICIDEKNHQLFAEKRAALPLSEGKPQRIDYEYIRKGVLNEFVCIEPKTGKLHIRTVERRTGRAFAKFLKFIVMRVYKNAVKIVLVTDNLNIHHEKAIRDTYGEEYATQIINRIEWHYTPKHASWLDQAEIAINGLTRAVLKRRIATKQEVQKQVRAYQKRMNANPRPIRWQFTRQKAKSIFHLNNNDL